MLSSGAAKDRSSFLAADLVFLCRISLLAAELVVSLLELGGWLLDCRLALLISWRLVVATTFRGGGVGVPTAGVVDVSRSSRELGTEGSDLFGVTELRKYSGSAAEIS